MALPTHGRVLLDTTAGDIDIELWSKVRRVVVLFVYLNNVRLILKLVYFCIYFVRRKLQKHVGTSSRWPWRVRNASTFCLGDHVR
jgi:hypothetical protein